MLGLEDVVKLRVCSQPAVTVCSTVNVFLIAMIVLQPFEHWLECLFFLVSYYS
jgi:hypothetical protein